MLVNVVGGMRPPPNWLVHVGGGLSPALDPATMLANGGPPPGTHGPEAFRLLNDLLKGEAVGLQDVHLEPMCVSEAPDESFENLPVECIWVHRGL